MEFPTIEKEGSKKEQEGEIDAAFAEKEEIQHEGPMAPGILGSIQKLFRWLRENERHISAPIFILGFISDLFTVAPLSITYAVYLYGLYLGISFVASIGAHYLYVRRAEEGWFFRSLRVVLSLAAQFMVGGTLSGCLIFYAKNAALVASWPFVLLLIGLFIGNEFLRKYREQLAFRNIMFFFALYAYAIYAYPTLIHTISPQTFLESTLLALGIFLLYLLGLAVAGWHRFKRHFVGTMLGAAVIAGAVSVSYFGGVIPPLPLSLKEVGVYHSVVRTDGEYVVTSETPPSAEPKWYQFWDRPLFELNDGLYDLDPTIVHLVTADANGTESGATDSSGQSLSVFSSVFAPTAFSTAIIHRWDWYNPKTSTWQERAEIAFVIEGGRDGGYRGYSTLTDVQPGKYRVSIETFSGQVIGRLYFTVEETSTAPKLYTANF